MWTAEKYGYKLTVDYDTYPENPRDWDNEAAMVCWHRRYNLGDQHDYKSPDAFVWTLMDALCTTDELIEYLKSGRCDAARLVESDDNPDCWTLQLNAGVWKDAEDLDEIQLYNGRLQQAMEDMVFASAVMEMLDDLGKIYYKPLCLYDHSGITISTCDFGDRWDSGQVGWVYMDATTSRNAALKRMQTEVDLYDAYLRGENYCYTLEQDGEEIDGCGGFLGEFNDVLEQIHNNINLPHEMLDIIDELKEE